MANRCFLYSLGIQDGQGRTDTIVSYLPSTVLETVKAYHEGFVAYEDPDENEREMNLAWNQLRDWLDTAKIGQYMGAFYLLFDIVCFDSDNAVDLPPIDDYEEAEALGLHEGPIEAPSLDGVVGCS